MTAIGADKIRDRMQDFLLDAENRGNDAGHILSYEEFQKAFVTGNNNYHQGTLNATAIDAQMKDIWSVLVTTLGGNTATGINLDTIDQNLADGLALGSSFDDRFNGALDEGLRKVHDALIGVAGNNKALAFYDNSNNITLKEYTPPAKNNAVPPPTLKAS